MKPQSNGQEIIQKYCPKLARLPYYPIVVTERTIMDKASDGEYSVLLEIFFRTMHFPPPSERLKRILSSHKEVVADLVRFWKEKNEINNFFCVVKHGCLSASDKAELWGIFHNVFPEMCNRELWQIDKNLAVVKLVKHKLSFFGKINVLELGCGKIGLALYQLASMFPKRINAYGVDLATKHGVSEGVAIIKGDVRNLSFKSNTFDVVYSFSVLMYHLPDSEIPSIFREAYRVLKKHGVFLFDKYSDDLPQMIEEWGLKAKIKNWGAHAQIMIKY